MNILWYSLWATLYVWGSKSACMEDEKRKEHGAKHYKTYDKELWSIHGKSIEKDSKVLRIGLEALQLPTHTIFEQKIAEEDRHILYAFYALTKHIPYEHALGKQTFEQIASLARSFWKLGHIRDIRPYFAVNIFSASEKQITEYCTQHREDDLATVNNLLRHPQCFYQRAPYTTPKIEKTPITRCGKCPVVVESGIWSINPSDRKELWYASLIEGKSRAKRLTRSISALCASDKNLFATTDSGALISPYCDNEDIMCDEIALCDHPITLLAASPSGRYVIVANPNFFSIIKRSSGSCIVQKATQFSIQAVGIYDTSKKYSAIALGKSNNPMKKNLISCLTIFSTKKIYEATREFFLGEESPILYTLGRNNTIHYALQKSPHEWALCSIETALIPELILPLVNRSQIPTLPVTGIRLIQTNRQGTLSVALIKREKIEKSWIIWDHTTDEIHELPDHEFDLIVPENVAENGDISVIAGNTNTGYHRITIHARPHLSFVNDPKSSFKSRLFLLAALGAHCVDGILSVEDDKHWKESFTELPQSLQNVLTTYYPVYTESLLGEVGKSILT